MNDNEYLRELFKDILIHLRSCHGLLQQIHADVEVISRDMDLPEKFGGFEMNEFEKLEGVHAYIRIKDRMRPLERIFPPWQEHLEKSNEVQEDL